MPLQPPAPSPPDAEDRYDSPWPVDLRATLRPLGHGPLDPCHQLTADGALWRTTLTDRGPAAYRLTQADLGTVRCQAWGPGADDVIAGLPDLLGARDDTAEFDPQVPLIREAHRTNPGLRVPRTNRVMESLIPAILEQRVTAEEAFNAWRWLVRRYGEAAPAGPPSMRVPPPAAVWARVPSWDWHRAGVDVHRARTARECARRAERLEECCGMSHADAAARLQVMRGVGAWTAAEVSQRAFGNTDALSVGDYHLATFVGWALAGHAVDDDGMVELLEQYRPQRYRVVRLLFLSGFRAPRFAPRMTPRQHLGF